MNNDKEVGLQVCLGYELQVSCLGSKQLNSMHVKAAANVQKYKKLHRGNVHTSCVQGRRESTVVWLSR